MKYLFLSVALLFGLAAAGVGNTTSSTPADTKATAPDNSAVNADRTVTAEDQSTTPRDAELTRKIRRELTKDDTLSTYAQNIKIVTQNGKVTLVGPVETEAEKAKIVAKAARIAGRGAVTNQLEVSGR